MELGIAGIPHTHWIPAGMETNGAGIERECLKYFTDFPREFVAVLDFYRASVPTSESNIHFVHVQNFWCVFNHSHNGDWNIGFG